MTRVARHRKQKADKPDAEDHGEDYAGNLREWGGKRNQGDDPPDQPKDKAHDEDGNEQRDHKYSPVDWMLKMTTEQEERLVAAFESIALSLSRRLEIDHPPVTEPPEAEVYNIHDAHKEPETKEEYATHEGGKGRYATLIENAQRAGA